MEYLLVADVPGAEHTIVGEWGPDLQDTVDDLFAQGASQVTIITELHNEIEVTR